MALFFLFVGLIVLCIVGMVIVIADEYVPVQKKIIPEPITAADAFAQQINETKQIKVTVPKFQTRDELKADFIRRTKALEARTKKQAYVNASY